MGNRSSLVALTSQAMAAAGAATGLATLTDRVKAVIRRAEEIRIGRPGRCRLASWRTAHEKVRPNSGGPSIEPTPWRLCDTP